MLLPYLNHRLEFDHCGPVEKKESSIYLGLIKNVQVCLFPNFQKNFLGRVLKLKASSVEIYLYSYLNLFKTELAKPIKKIRFSGDDDWASSLWPEQF